MNLSSTWKTYFANQLVIKPFLTDDFAKYAETIEDATIEEHNGMLPNSAFRCFAYVKDPAIDEMTHTIQLCHHYAAIDYMLGWGVPSHIYHVTLHGFGTTSSPMIVNKDKPPSGFRFDMPKQKALFKTAISQEHLLELKDKTDSKLNVLIPTLVQVPPFLFATLIELTNASPSEAFFIVRTAIGTFANERASSESSKSEKAASVAEVWNSTFYFLQFLWAATAHPDELVVTFADPPPGTLPIWWAKSQDGRLAANQPITHPTDRAPLPSSLPNSVEGINQATATLAIAASTLAASTDRLTDSRLTTTGATASKSWEKQPDFVRNFALRMMAQNEFDDPRVPTASFVEFLSLSNNPSAATQYIKNYLQSTLLCQDLRMDPFTVICLTQICPEYNLAEGPSRLSLFLLFDPATSLVYSTNDDIVDQATIDSSGEYGMSYDQFKWRVSDKKILWVPLNVNDFQTTLRNMQSVLIFMFGSCFASEQLASWASHIDMYRASYRHCQGQDKTFFAQQLTIIDNALQAFFRTARKASSSVFLVFTLLSFDNQQQAIAVCNPMASHLHPRVQALFATDKASTPTSTPNKRHHEKMEKEVPGGEIGKMVKNPKHEPTFKLRTGVNYRDVFSADTIRAGVPELNGEQVCCRWQVLGRCYDKCARAASHVTLKDDVRAKFSQFFSNATAN